MNSRSFSDSTWARSSRPLPAQLVTPMTRASVVADEPRTAARTMARGRNGMTRNQSSKAIRTRSVRPPTKPAVTPTAEPMTTATIVATTPMKRLIRAPQMSWARTLRPISSVPSGNSALGGARSGLPRPAAAVSSRAGTSSGAARATATKRSRMARPTTPARSRSSCRPNRAAAWRRRVHAELAGRRRCRCGHRVHRSGRSAGSLGRSGDVLRSPLGRLVPLTGAPCGCGGRGSRTAGRRRGWPRSSAALDRKNSACSIGEVVVLDGVGRGQPEARVAEHGLGGDGPTDHEAEPDGDQRDRRQHGVRHRVAAHHLVVAQALGPRHGQVVLPFTVSMIDDRMIERVRAEVGEHERQHRQEEVAGAVDAPRRTP